MLEPNSYLRWSLPIVLLWLTTVAAAQSNQPIYIDPQSSHQQGHRGNKSSPADRFSDSAVRASDDRLTRLAERLATAAASKPQAPVEPKSPSLPRESKLSQAQRGIEGKPLSVTAGDDRKTSLMIDPIERQKLGAPVNSPIGAQAASNSDPAAAKSGWVLNTLTALGVVGGLILLVRTVLSRWTGRVVSGANSPMLEVLSRVSVAPRNHVLLMRLGKRILIVGDSSAGLQTLANIDDPEEVAGLLATVAAERSNNISGGFRHLLGRFNSEYHNDLRKIEEGNDTSERHVDRARDQLSGLLSRIRTLTSRGGAV